ncbi:MAG: hypothetical protein JNG88_15935 [Phycisphaerales bacterium]|nr:hypothetical protein [Phycisphaerales bacterium]
MLELIEQGPIHFLTALEKEKEERRGRSRAARQQRAALDRLLAYQRPNVHGLWYGARLAQGLPIGSGLIEGACKTIVDRRLKPNSARWLPARAEQVAALCCLLYGEQWDDFWKTQAA